MSGQNWYPHYARDFIDGVQGLGPDVIGAYIIVLDLIYARGGPVRNDPRHLGGILGCSTRLAAGLIQKLVDAGKLQFEGELLVNPKAAAVLEKAAKLTRNLAEAGAKGGRTRAEKDAAAKENSELAQASLKHITGQDNIREEGREGAQAREANSLPANLDDAVPPDLGDMQKLAQECAHVAGTRQIDPAQFGKDIGLCRDWTAVGASPALILQTIREGVAAAANPIFSLRFFDQPIRTAVAKQKALENGTVPRNSAAPVDEVASRALARMAARRATDSDGALVVPG